LGRTSEKTEAAPSIVAPYTGVPVNKIRVSKAAIASSKTTINDFIMISLWW
jgi:hypothetical protein